MVYDPEAKSSTFFMGPAFEDVKTRTTHGGAFRPLTKAHHKLTFGVAVAVSANRALAFAAFEKSASRK